MEDHQLNRNTVSEIEYDLATLSLKGRRFKEAGDMFMELVIKSQSSEAWCGLGLSRLGLLLESTTIDEVFFCFDKAKAAGADKVAEIENLVLQTVAEAVGNLYNLYVQAVLMSRTAKYKRNMAMISTALNTVLTMTAINNNRVMGSLAYAGITAVSYDRYLDSVQTIEQMTALYNKAARSVEELKKHTRTFVTVENAHLEKFFEFTKDQEQQVIELLKTDAQRAEEQNAARLKLEKEKRQQYLEQQKNELSVAVQSIDPSKEEAIRLYKERKYKEALPMVNYCISMHKNDVGLINIQNSILTLYARWDIAMAFIPWLITSVVFCSRLFHLKAGPVLCVTTFLFLVPILYRHVKRKEKLPAPATHQ